MMEKLYRRSEGIKKSWGFMFSQSADEIIWRAGYNQL